MFAGEKQLNYFNKMALPYPKEWTDAQINQLKQAETQEALNKQLQTQNHNFVVGLEKLYEQKSG